MRIMGIDCGCDNRQEIMFDAGQIGLPEAAILAAAVGLILVFYVARRKGVNLIA